ncbi:uncharacterized protein rnf180a [Odontesthes bonariensis]
MSSYVRTSVVSGSSRVGGGGNGDAGEENRNSESHNLCSKAVRPRLRSSDPAREGRSSNVEQLVRPALPGRKSHRKTFTEGRRWREGNQERDEERPRAEHWGSREREKQRQRETKSTETHGDGTHDGQGRRSTESSPSSNSDIQLNSILETGEGSNNSQRRNTYPRPQGIGFTQNITSNSNSQSPRPAIQTRSTALPPQRLSSRAAAGDLHSHSSREADPFWIEMRTGEASGQLSQSQYQYQTHISPLTLSEPEEEDEEEEGNTEDEEEEGSGVMEVMSQAITVPVVPSCIPFGERRMSKREKNRIKSLRRRQRRREKWRQSQQQESRQSSTGNPTTTSSSSSSSSEDDEALSTGDREGFICAVCLDVYFSPYMCHPCNHIFCEPCLRTLAKNSPTNTPCPLCRTIITHVFFQKDLNQTARTFFPKEYLSRKQSFQKASCAKWPLPSCRKLFRIFGGFQRQPSPIMRRQFPHGGGYRLDAMDFEDDSRGWRFDMDMVIIYIYSVNWIIGFFIFCFLCYLFFPSF